MNEIIIINNTILKQKKTRKPKKELTINEISDKLKKHIKTGKEPKPEPLLYKYLNKPKPELNFDE